MYLLPTPTTKSNEYIVAINSANSVYGSFLFICCRQLSGCQSVSLSNWWWRTSHYCLMQRWFTIKCLLTAGSASAWRRITMTCWLVYAQTRYNFCSLVADCFSSFKRTRIYRVDMLWLKMKNLNGNLHISWCLYGVRWNMLDTNNENNHVIIEQARSCSCQYANMLIWMIFLYVWWNACFETKPSVIIVTVVCLWGLYCVHKELTCWLYAKPAYH